MTTTTHRYLRRCGVSPSASVAAAIVLAPILCAASPHRIVPTETAVATVTVADLDLSTAEGARIARRRLQVAALRLCRAFSDSRRVANVATLRDCSRDAVADAVRRVNAVTSLVWAPLDGRTFNLGIRVDL